MGDRNAWNRFIYARWAPFYDGFINLPFFVRARAQTLALLDLQAGERVLLVGIGTGADLPLLPEGIEATGIDLSEAMLEKARARLPIPGREIVLQPANAEDLPFLDNRFDAAILTLILSVTGDGTQALRETIRILKPGGRLVIFDKFLASGTRPSFGRRLLNVLLTKPFGTDINRSLEPMLEGLPCRVVSNRPSSFSNSYRIILLKKEV